MKEVENIQMSRRGFLRCALVSCSGLAFAAWTKDHVAEDEDHFFLRIKLNGGWDTSLCFDPWIKEMRPSEEDLYLEYRPQEVVKAGEIYLGPAATCLVPFAKDLTVINGIFMSKFDQGHPAGVSYMDTGSNRGNFPSFTVQLSENTRSGPYGIVSNEGLVLNDSKAQSISTEAILNLRSDTLIVPFIKGLVNGSQESELVKAQAHLVKNLPVSRRLFFELDRLENKHGRLDDFHVIAASFLSGASYQADLTWNNGLDTHTGHAEKHMKFLAQLLKRIGEGLKLFKSVPYGKGGKSLFDVTTFLITSEFSRVPWLNGAKGKDHNPLCNSAVLAGKGVKGGRTIGGSKLILGKDSANKMAYQMAAPIDFETGKLAMDSLGGVGFIYPENLLKTVSRMFDPGNVYFKTKYQEYRAIPGL